MPKILKKLAGSQDANVLRKPAGSMVMKTPAGKHGLGEMVDPASLWEEGQEIYAECVALANDPEKMLNLPQGKGVNSPTQVCFRYKLLAKRHWQFQDSPKSLGL